MSEWIGVDLDGTLAKSVINYEGAIGAPVPAMLERVKRWLSDGKAVRVLTARRLTTEQTAEIKRWLNENNIGKCGIQNHKDRYMIALWDDKAIRVEKNSGKVCSGCARHADSLGKFSDIEQVMTDC